MRRLAGGFLKGHSQRPRWSRGVGQSLVKRRGEGVFKKLWPGPKFKIRRKFLSIEGEKVGVWQKEFKLKDNQEKQ